MPFDMEQIRKNDAQKNNKFFFDNSSRLWTWGQLCLRRRRAGNLSRTAEFDWTKWAENLYGRNE